MHERDGAEALATLFGRPSRIEALETLVLAHGGLVGLYAAGPRPLIETLGPGKRRAVEALFEMIGDWLAPVELVERADGPDALLRHMAPRLSLEPVETFWVVSLDARCRPLGMEKVSMGTLTACLVHPREVFAPAIRCRAASVVVVHNHPSGDPEPSDEDVELTERLVEAGRLLGIPLVDHLVVARGGTCSLIARAA